MSKYFSLVWFLILSSCLSAQSGIQSTEKLSYDPPIPWNPSTYVCERSIDSIIIDGLGDELSWRSIPWSEDFEDIEGDLKPNPHLQTNMKMMWDDNYLYFLAKMEEPHIWAKLTERDAIVYQDDAFEIFIDPNGDGHNYYELQVNANNTLWDLFVMWPYRQKVYPNLLSNWDAAGIKHAVHIQGTLNDPNDEDEYWTMEMAVPWSALREMAPKAKPPKPNDQWRMNFARVDWPMTHVKEGYEKSIDKQGEILKEKYWTWTPHDEVNMHKPEWWGYVQFVDESVGEYGRGFDPDSNEKIKWALWQLYFQQTAYHEKHGHYLKDINQFTLSEQLPCPFRPKLFAGDYGFQFSNPSCNGKRTWVINEMGKIRTMVNY